MIEEKVFYDLCRSVDSPLSLGLWLRYRDAPNELATASIDPLAYNDSYSFHGDYACLSFLRKWVGLKTGIDLEAAALQRFVTSEAQCMETNKRLWKCVTDGRVDQLDSAVLHRAQEILTLIWGRPTFQQLFSRCGWGPGSTSTLSGDAAGPESKILEFPLSITPAAVPYMRQHLRDDHHWSSLLVGMPVEGSASLTDACFCLTSASKLLTVPKDAKTNRTICAEPTGNIYLQKGVGKYLRSRLMRWSINLDEQSNNQQYAALAAEHGYATLDLKAASDTISIAVVKLLCPPDMFSVLNALRSPAYQLDAGGESRFHKFSSMGNGFTFELESAIFFAVCKAVSEVAGCQGPVSVYGDDIIVDQSIAHRVIHALEVFGFTVNDDKSFISGRFFESCGKHYFDGFDVTPVYQKHEVGTKSSLEYIRMVNRLFTLSTVAGNDRLSQLWRRWFDARPKCFSDAVQPASLTFDAAFQVPLEEFDGQCHVIYGMRINWIKPIGRRPQVGDVAFYYKGLRSIGNLDKPATNGQYHLRPRRNVVKWKKVSSWVPLSKVYHTPVVGFEADKMAKRLKALRLPS